MKQWAFKPLTGAFDLFVGCCYSLWLNNWWNIGGISHTPHHSCGLAFTMLRDFLALGYMLCMDPGETPESCKLLQIYFNGWL